MPDLAGMELAPDVAEKIAALAADMRANGGGREDPVRSVMGLLGDRWSTLILLVLATGEWRHADLRRMTAQLSAEQAISQRVLTMKLRALEREGFALRHATTDVPPKVSYALSQMGMELVSEIRRQIDWIAARAGQITAAREKFDHDQRGSMPCTF